MKQYQDLLSDILLNGVLSENRTGINTQKVFGRFLNFDLSEGFPVLTTKKIHFKSVVGELLWFLEGSESNTRLVNNYGVKIWSEWEDENGNLGPIYGSTWRNFGGVDQIAQVIDEIKTNPDSRRLIVTAWDPPNIDAMALPPCHMIYQFQVQEGRLSCMMMQRSVDSFLGLPFNIASYALLTSMIAQVTGYKPGTLHMALGDTHIYQNHFTQVGEQLDREPRKLPQLWLNPVIKDIDRFAPGDIKLVGYSPYPPIKAKVAV